MKTYANIFIKIFYKLIIIFRILKNMLTTINLQKTLINIANNSKLVEKIKNLLQDFSKIYLVGGIIRDIALEKEALDIDICTSLNINKVSEILGPHLKIIDTGKRHGTISAFLDTEHVEITEFRGKQDSLVSDLELRDFTINAIAFDLINNEIIDPFNGLDDLKNNILRCPIDPNKVFLDDPLRILRAFRFSYAQDRIPDNNLEKALKTNFDKLKSISIERIRDELSKILLSNNPVLALKKIEEFGGLKILFPELSPMVNCKQNKYHIHDVFNHTLDVLKNTPPVLEARLAALLHDVGKPFTVSTDELGERHFYGHEKESVRIAKDFLERLCFSKKIINTVTTVINLHMRSLEAGGSGIRRLIKDLNGTFNIWLMLIKADKPPKMDEIEFKQRLDKFLENYNAEITAQEKRDFLKLKISGEDIMNCLNLQPSKKVGEIKNKLEELITDDPSKNTKEFLLEYLKKLKNY